MRHIESKIQRNIIHLFRLSFPDSLLFCVPNGGFRNKMEAARLKAEGVTAGVSDLIFIHKGHIYFFEVKSEHGVQSLLQEQFQKFVEKQGFKYFIVRSAGEALDIVEKL